MRIVVAPDSFKGSISAKQAADSIKAGILKVSSDVDVVCVPMADGGEGTVQSMVDATDGEIVYVKVKGPLLQEVDSFYGVLGDGKTAVIEMAAASGLPLLKEEQRNPLQTTTFGTGELILHALDRGCRKIIMGIGGSATNDAGQGMAKALGVRFLDEHGEDIGFGGGCLSKLATIDVSNIDKRIKECEFTLACDVENQLCGTNGATYVFGPQKGANGKMMPFLDENLKHFSNILKKDLDIDIANTPGSGAAGGLGGGALAFLNATLSKGAEIVINSVKLDEAVKDADFVITGEGRMDFQTQYGKTPIAVAKVARKYDVPCIALVGQIGTGTECLFDLGIVSMFSIAEGPSTYEFCVDNAAELLQKVAERVARLIFLGYYKTKQ